MTKLLLRFFLKDSSQSETPQTRARVGRLSGIIGLICNLLLFAGKLIAGALSGSIAIVSDAFNNLSDAGSSVITLIGFRLAGKKPDPDHPYGHGRIEYMSALIVTFFIFTVGLEMFKASLETLISGDKLWTIQKPAEYLKNKTLLKKRFNNELNAKFTAEVTEKYYFDCFMKKQKNTISILS